MSSYSNGMVVDLYVDDGPGVNSKRGRPIVAAFATYNGTVHAADAMRNGIGYPPAWQSFHCELNDAAYPAVMDDYWLGGGGATPESCQNDTITRQFLTDRLLAKIKRPCS